MSREEDAIRATTRAIAATVRDVPPLELEPAPGELWSPGRGPRRDRRGGSGHRLRSWLTPVAAAAVVVAVAVTLVIAKGPQNGGVVPQPALTNSGPGGVPRYYVALDPIAGRVGGFGLLVGDTLTGQTLAVVNPPAHMSYASVTAAADDRTFLAFATNAPGYRVTGLNGRWYMLHLAPGTAHVVSLTSTPIHPQSGVRASALSGSGTLLAVAESGALQRVIVFSVATGRPLRIWSTKAAPGLWSSTNIQQNLLTWIDGDRAIAFSDDFKPLAWSVRRLNAGGPPGADDLMAGSQLIWSATAVTGRPCGLVPPLVSADGHTIGCATADAKHFQLTIAWRGYQASALAPAAGKYTTAYQFTRQVPGYTAFWADALWVSPSGSALIGEWTIDGNPISTTRPSSSGSASATPQPGVISAGVGVMSHGTFTPLRLPHGIINPLSGAAIAW